MIKNSIFRKLSVALIALVTVLSTSTSAFAATTPRYANK